MENDYTLLAVLVWLAIGFYFALLFISRILEPAYIYIFRRPIYLYWYPIIKTLSPARQGILIDNVPFYRRLSSRHKKYFEHRVVEFLERYQFHAKNGIVLTDEIYVMVAAAYVMLSFGMRHFKIEVFDKIIIYPDSYQSTISNKLHNGEFNPQLKAIVFSWKHFKRGYLEGDDNLNLGIHEFTHALHHHGMKRGDQSAIIFADRYARIMKEVKHPPNAKRLIDSEYFRIYAYTNDYEFLAVILEHFFETPQLFEKEFPQLFRNVKLMINYRH